MKFIISLVTLALSLLLPAQEIENELIENLLNTRDEKAFYKILETAEKSHLPKQTLLEARFLYFVDRQDTKALADLSKELLAAKDQFSPKNSNIFSLKEDWLAIVEFTQALNYLEPKNEELFKKHITEAFWLSPQQAGAYAPYIEKMRLQRAMRKIQITPDFSLKSLISNKSHIIVDKNKPVTILYFWSPWSREFSETIDDFKSVCASAKKSNISLLTILAEQSKEVELDAKAMISEEKVADSATWLLDTKHMGLSTFLRVQSVPTVVLVSQKGKILFNGHPTNPELWSTLESTVPGFKRPSPQQPLFNTHQP